MAQKIQALFIDDIDDIDGGEAEGTVRFDLNIKHSDDLRSALGKYISHARKVGGGMRQSGSRAGRKPGAVDTGAVRVWARENGIGIKDRGRVPPISWPSTRRQREPDTFMAGPVARCRTAIRFRAGDVTAVPDLAGYLRDALGRNRRTPVGDRRVSRA
jgi:Lsr2